MLDQLSVELNRMELVELCDVLEGLVLLYLGFHLVLIKGKELKGQELLHKHAYSFDLLELSGIVSLYDVQ